MVKYLGRTKWETQSILLESAVIINLNHRDGQVLRNFHHQSNYSSNSRDEHFWETWDYYISQSGDEELAEDAPANSWNETISSDDWSRYRAFVNVREQDGLLRITNIKKMRNLALLFVHSRVLTPTRLLIQNFLRKLAVVSNYYANSIFMCIW